MAVAAAHSATAFSLLKNSAAAHARPAHEHVAANRVPPPRQPSDHVEEIQMNGALKLC
jgi:hypothetical protein